MSAPSGLRIDLDSVIIATDQPGQLADWYSAVLGADRESDNVVRHGGIELILFPHDAVAGPAPQPERMMLNFRIDDPDGFRSRVDRLGVVWKRPFEREAFGLLATLQDPDGNYVQFLSRDQPASP